MGSVTIATVDIGKAHPDDEVVLIGKTSPDRGRDSNLKCVRVCVPFLKRKERERETPEKEVVMERQIMNSDRESVYVTRNSSTPRPHRPFCLVCAGPRMSGASANSW